MAIEGSPERRDMEGSHSGQRSYVNKDMESIQLGHFGNLQGGAPYEDPEK